MRVLVTGASGFLGSAVCDALLARGDETVGLTRDPQRARQGNPTVTWHAWNPATERPPASAWRVSTASSTWLASRSTSAGPRLPSNGSATAASVPPRTWWTRSRRRPRPKTLVSQSAVGYYGDRGEAVVDESTGPGSTFDAEVCVAWEAAAHAAEQVGVRVVVVRTGLVLDPEHGLLKQLLLPFKLGVGGPLAGGAQYVPWIHVDDEVRLLLWALDTGQASGTYNAAAPNPVTNREFSKALGRVLGRPAIVPVPKLALKARFGDELGEVAAGGQRTIPRRALDAGFEFRHPEVEPALRDLLRR